VKESFAASENAVNGARTMNRCAIAAIVLPGSLLVADHGSKEGMPKLNRPDELKWKDGPPSLPPGAQFAVLEGDPSKPGPFVFRVKVPDGYRIPVHTHPKPERVTVIAGTFKLGMGDVFDESKMDTLPSGTYGTWPPGMKHYIKVKGETIVQFHGEGPWTISYVNLKDDPRQPDEPGEALRQFLSALAKSDLTRAYAMVAPSTKEDGDPISNRAKADYASFQAEAEAQPSGKFGAYELGKRSEEGANRVRIFVHFKSGDNDEALLIREGNRWYVGDPVHIIR
jgi:quercetin dioxygenase-like cupin family protein